MVDFWMVYYFTMIIMGLMMLGLVIAVVGFTVVHGYKKNKKDAENGKYKK